MNDFLKEFQNTTCEVRLDAISQAIYSVDASIYEIKPKAIVLPKNRADLIAAVKIAYKNDLAITPRGAATGITGACLGNGVILDTSKYLNDILEINIAAKTVSIEPGVIQDHLNEALFSHGYRLGPDTSTGDRATIGGMAANNAAGARSLFYGTMSDAVIEIELVLSNGEILNFKEISEEEWHEKCRLPTQEGDIYRTLNNIRTEYKEEIAKNFPQIPRRVSGYHLDALIQPFPLNAAKILIGSEGTLGVFSKITVKIAPLPMCTAICIVAFDSMQDAMKAVEPILQFSPLALELIDAKIIEAGKKAPSMKGKLDWLITNPQALLVAEFQAENESELKNKVALFELAGKQLGTPLPSLFDAKTMAHVWSLRKAGLGLLLSKRSYSRAIAFIEDLSIPPARLPQFMEKFLQYLAKNNKTAGIYGHAGSGCLHIRPYMDLREKAERELAEQMMQDISDLVLSMNGSLSGEHGDGLVRSWLNEKMFGKDLYQAFLKLKQAFDPKNLMNPGKIVNGQKFAENLRPAPQETIKTFFSFAKEGGLVLSADLCNGNGQCRKQTGIMCPSFQVTNDEYDTTRARANTFRGIFNRTLPETNLASNELHHILDLCIQCKGCKTECPSQVDMAKMKAEALYHYQEEKGYSLRSRLFAHIPAFFKIGSILPRMFNAFGNLPFLKKLAGIATQRKLPKLAKYPFSRQSESTSKPAVVLFIDTYTQFLLPHVGHAAITVLEFLGYQVITPSWQCCGRTLISKGFLKDAKEKARQLIHTLLPYAKKNIPIIGLEPSCLLSFQDEYLDFFPESSIIASQSMLFDSFIAAHLRKGKNPFAQFRNFLEIFIHTHCHQKAIIGTRSTLEVLRAFPNVKTTEIGSGCCGMAGSFGYESEHYDFSYQIANLSLLPAIEAMPAKALIVANGFSCRTQIEELSGKKAYHLAELLVELLKDKTV